LRPTARSGPITERPVRILAEGDELAVPEVLPGFSVVVRRFFD
jgi:hypothetical protein